MPESKRSERPYKKLGLVGLGLLGKGIAACLVSHDYEVVAFDANVETRKNTPAFIREALSQLIERADFSPEILNAFPERYHEAESYEAFSEVDFVIESIYEDMEAKVTLFRELEKVIGKEVPLASNTSSFPISLMQENLAHPERLVGMHWHTPVQLTKFLEVIKGKHTSEEVFRKTAALGESLGKEPVLVLKDVRGFIANRLGYALLREALYLLEEGVGDAESIDRAVRNTSGTYAALVGPFRMMDLFGIAAFKGAMEEMLPELCNSTETPKTVTELTEKGCTGAANGKGFYSYTPEQTENWDKALTELSWDILKLTHKYKNLE